jgi:hypothetical protein
MSEMAELVKRARQNDVVNMSLTAGFEIEKSRLKRDFNPEIVHQFGSLLRKRTMLSPEGEGKGLAHPEFAVSINQLYRQKHGDKSASLSKIYDFLEEIAVEFEKFEGSISDEEKTRLVELSARLHELLSEENRNSEGDVEYGWRK